MEISIKLGPRIYRIVSEAIDIAIPLKFNQPQPNTYGVPGATANPYEGSGFVGDVRQGGSCNFETYKLVPHCNGTHTECVGHIAANRITIHEVLNESFIPSSLISVSPVRAADTRDTYDPPLAPEDRVIDKKSLEHALADCDPVFLEGLVIRTLPNPEDKLTRDYMQTPPPFFTLDAMACIRSMGIRHLLMDMPSVDRLFDEGKLNAHRIFWEVAAGAHDINPATCSQCTITEMIYVPEAIADGSYLLNLQIAPFMSDAAPSRPRLFRVSGG